MDFSKESKLAIDANDVGVDAVILQEGKYGELISRRLFKRYIRNTCTKL
jgi:hypothetical protein